MPFLDGALGIYHTEDHLRHYLNEMREYMPPEHRLMIEKVEKRSNAKEVIHKSKKLKNEYNKCLEEIRRFRAMHLEFAATYIHKQSQIKNPFGRGGLLFQKDFLFGTAYEYKWQQILNALL